MDEGTVDLAMRERIKRQERWTLIGLTIALLCLLIDKATAEDWTPPDHPCIPTVSDYDHAYKVEGAAFAVLWWCDEEDGLYTRWFTGTVPGAVTPETQAAAIVQLAGKDPFDFLQRAYKRPSSPSEMELVNQLQAERGPRCYVQAAGKTTAVLTSTAQYTISTPLKDEQGVTVSIAANTPVACVSRLPKELTKRYCNCIAATDTKGRAIVGDAWVLCRMVKAPAEGWQ